MRFGTLSKTIAVAVAMAFAAPALDAGAGPLKKRRVYIDNNISDKQLKRLQGQLARNGRRRDVQAEITDEVYSRRRARSVGRSLGALGGADLILGVGIAGAALATRGGGGLSHGHGGH